MISKILNKFGYERVQKDIHHKYPDITDSEFWELYKICSPFTMTGVDRLYALYTGIKYVLSNNIPGHFVECGVWRGGSSMLIACMLKNRNILDRKIYLFDTFEGMDNPGENDFDYQGNNAQNLLDGAVDNKEESVWCLASYEEVKKNMGLTGFSPENILLVKGKVEDTIHSDLICKEIALLRLDTDWYGSTKHELVHLYPILSLKGVLIIDDYGHWEGCRKAVDEYFLENNIHPLFSRIDYTGRMLIKI